MRIDIPSADEVDDLVARVHGKDIRAWADDALCRRGVDPSWWFPETGVSPRHPNVKNALAVCKECPVIQSCLEYGLVHEPYGIWGGLTEQQRERVRQTIGLRPLLWRKRKSPA